VGTVKANWFDATSVEDSDDPLGPPIEIVGQLVEVGDEGKLEARLTALMGTEGRLWEANITCAIRDRTDTCCSACPVRHTDPLESLSELCRVGVEQERVVTAMAVQRQLAKASDDDRDDQAD
jgi:hypothetical protein